MPHHRLIRKSVFLLILFFWVFPPHLSAAEPLKVEVSFEQASVQPGMMFLAHVKVVNPGRSNKIFWVHQCAYDENWKVGHDSVFIQSWTCQQDELERISLQPGDIFQKSIILYTSKDFEGGPLAFRLAFKPLNRSGTERDFIWSEPLSMLVSVPASAESPIEVVTPPDET